MGHTISFSSCSDIGASRAENEDSFGIFPQDPLELPGPQGQLFVVADGMGGHSGGQEASTTAVRSVAQHYFAHQTGETAEALQHALAEANAEIYQRAQTAFKLQGMGSTCTALVLKDSLACLAHVGDSRAYRITPKNIWQLTRDHSKVAEMQRQGILTEQEALHHPERSIITRALGLTQEVEVDVIDDIPVNPGECFLLCTDGLAKVDEKTIQTVALLHSPDAACRKLVELAISCGGQDNITVQLIRFGEAHASARTTPPDHSRFAFQKSILLAAALVLMTGMALLVYKFAVPARTLPAPQAEIAALQSMNKESASPEFSMPLAVDTLQLQNRTAMMPRRDSVIQTHLHDSTSRPITKITVPADSLTQSVQTKGQQNRLPARPAASPTIFGMRLSEWRWPGLRVKKDYQVQDDKLLFFATAKNKLALQDTSVADVDLQVRAKVFSAAPAGRLGIILGHTQGKTRSSQTFFLFALDAAGECTLQKIANGAEEMLFRKAASLDSADTLHLAVKNLGQWILTYVNGKLVGNWEGEDFIKGGTGLYADPQVKVEFLELKMTKAVGLEEVK